MTDRKTFVIVNPQAAGGRSLRSWPHIADRLHRAIGGFDYDFTNAGGAATVLAAEAVSAGYRYIVAVGGDGTVNEVVNGLIGADGTRPDPDLVLGCLPAGSGTDLWKTFHLDTNLHQSIRRLQAAETRACDLVRVELIGPDGRPTVRYCCNMADVGLGGEVVSRTKRLPAWGNGFFNYLVASATAFWSWTPPMLEIVVDGAVYPREALVIALVANGQYCGGGMWIAPAARMDDGLIDLCCIRALPKHHLFAVLPRLYTGRLDGQAFSWRARGREIAITSRETVQVTLDGEVAGTTPARFTILPRALALRL